MVWSKKHLKNSVNSVFGIILTLTAAGCGEKSKSEGAEFIVLPAKPIVILGDTKVNGKDVKGPWFSFRLKMSNKTDQAITIPALAIKVFAEDSSGKRVITELNFSASDFSYATTGTPSIKCDFASFGTWQPGQNEVSFSLQNSNPQCDGFPIFSIGDGQKGKTGKNFNYTIEVTPVGWFGTYDTPADRFDTRFNFYTQ